MTDAIPVAVPLDICLANIYSPSGETSPGLEVSVAITILETIIANNGLEKFRSLNAKVLDRISTPDNLALWYVLRHAGFQKDGDRLICPNTVQLDTIKAVLNKLVELAERNAKIASGEIAASQPKFTPRSQQQQQQGNDQSMSDGPVVEVAGAAEQQEQQQQEQQQQEQEQPAAAQQVATPPQSPPSNSMDDESSPSSPQAASQSTSPMATKNVAQMTAAEKKEYVTQLMAQKKAAAAAKK